MRNFRGIFFVSMALALIFVCGSLWAQEAAAPKTKKKPLPKSGALSSSGTLPNGAQSVGLPWGSDAIRGGSPVSGSVSKANEKQWNLRLFNNSKDSYDVNLTVQQFNERRVRVKTDHFSYKLGPKEKAQRQVASAIGASFAELSLDSWKKTASAANAEDQAQQQNAEQQALEAMALGKGKPVERTQPKPTEAPENPEEFLGNMGYQGN